MKAIYLAAGLTLMAAMTACQPNTASDEAAVLALLHAQFDTPGVTLDVDPVAVSGDVAVADWIMADRGGRGLLRKRDGKWVLTMCGGQAFRTAEGLKQAGIAEMDASIIAGKLSKAEAGMTAERRAKLDSFGPTIAMDHAASQGNH